MYEIPESIRSHKESRAEYAPTDADLVEPSPSTGWRTVYRLMGVAT